MHGKIFVMPMVSGASLLSTQGCLSSFDEGSRGLINNVAGVRATQKADGILTVMGLWAQETAPGEKQ